MHTKMRSANESLPRLPHRSSKATDDVSSPKFLGRMSWQKDVLETDTVDGAVLYSLASPTKKRDLTGSSSTPSLSLTPANALRTLQYGSGGNYRKGDVLSYEESMDEVERILREHMKDVQRQKAGGVKAISTLKQSADRRNPITREFEFAPLRDVEMIAATTRLRSKQELELEQGYGDDDDADEAEGGTRSRTESMGNRKYFGATAKAAYYNTYHDLHGKPHLFIDKPKKRVVAKTLKASAALSTALDRRKASALKSIAQLTNTSLNPVESPLSTQESVKRRLALQPALRANSISGSLMDVSSPSIHSPRVRFLSACIAKSHPAISLVLRKANCHAFDFSHQSLGDDFIIQFAACLPDLPHVETINASDNRLSDHALNELLLALENKPNLTKLDISENEIGRESARSLRKYIASSLCTVKTLVLNDADIDDHECTLFMIAFEQNKSVEKLLMRSNRIGQTRKSMALGAASTAAASLPIDKDAAGAPLPSGSESIGSMLNVNLTIQELDLSWNMLRHGSVAPIATALLLLCMNLNTPWWPEYISFLILKKNNTTKCK